MSLTSDLAFETRLGANLTYQRVGTACREDLRRMVIRPDPRRSVQVKHLRQWCQLRTNPVGRSTRSSTSSGTSHSSTTIARLHKKWRYHKIALLHHVSEEGHTTTHPPKSNGRFDPVPGTLYVRAQRPVPGYQGTRVHFYCWRSSGWAGGGC